MGALLLVVLLAGSGAAGPDDPEEPAHGANHPYRGPGPVHLPAGHMVPVSGLQGIAVVDGEFDPVGGYVCQTAPGDSACLPSHPSMAGRVFCNGIVLREGYNWDPGQDVWVWVGSPFDTLGKGHGITCERPRPASTGFIVHWE